MHVFFGARTFSLPLHGSFDARVILEGESLSVRKRPSSVDEADNL